jgi:hypothetical protein
MKGHPDDRKSHTQRLFRNLELLRACVVFKKKDQWSCHPLRDLSKDAGLVRGELPVVQPYPPPVWADCRDPMRSSRELALPMPLEKPKSASPPAHAASSTATVGDALLNV